MIQSPTYSCCQRRAPHKSCQKAESQKRVDVLGLDYRHVQNYEKCKTCYVYRVSANTWYLLPRRQKHGAYAVGEDVEGQSQSGHRLRDTKGFDDIWD